MLFHLPGDIVIERGKSCLYFLINISIISLILSIIFWSRKTT